MNKNGSEIWKTYPEFDWIQGSSHGRVRTLDRVIVTNGRGTRLVKGRILKQRRNKGGYMQVVFWINGKTVNKLVHRIVAQTFLPNPDNLPEVNHKDCDRTNNNIDNLEWCDASYNQRYREKHGEAQGRSVIAVNSETYEVLQFPSQMEAGRQLGASQGNIHDVLTGRYKTTHGFWFTNADSNAVESTRAKFGDEVARKVEQLMSEKDYN